MVNWYLIRDGKIVTRYGDQPPATYTDPASGQVLQVGGLAPQDLAVLGWLQGQPTTPPASFDPATQKSFVQPTVPPGLDDWVKAYTATGKFDAVPMVIEQWVVQPLSATEIAQIQNQLFRDVRSQRDAELLRTDIFMLADSPIVADPVQFAAWKSYRQQLRDLFTNVTDPAKVVFPTPPGAGPITSATSAPVSS